MSRDARVRAGRAPGLLLVTILVCLGTVLYVNNRAVPAPVVMTEPVNAPSPRAAFMPPLGADVIPQRSVHTIGHIVTGDAVGLYGGTQSNTCSPAGIQTFLDANPAPAQAWAQALLIQPSDIHRYLGSLTALTLRTDTAVTNHGYENGVATPFQSVLQAGTAVLVDAEGLPRVRCRCGNPLQTPAPQVDVRYEGPRWEGFEPESVTSIDPAPKEVKEFVVVNVDNDTVVTRPRTTDGHEDHPVDPVVEKTVRSQYFVNKNDTSPTNPPNQSSSSTATEPATSARSGTASYAIQGQLDTAASITPAITKSNSSGNTAAGTATETDTAMPTVTQTGNAEIQGTSGPSVNAGVPTPTTNHVQGSAQSSRSDKTTMINAPTKTTAHRTTTHRTTTHTTTTNRTTVVTATPEETTTTG